MAVAGAGAGAEIMVKVGAGAGAENKIISAPQHCIYVYVHAVYKCTCTVHYISLKRPEKTIERSYTDNCKEL